MKSIEPFLLYDKSWWIRGKWQIQKLKYQKHKRSNDVFQLIKIGYLIQLMNIINDVTEKRMSSEMNPVFMKKIKMEYFEYLWYELLGWKCTGNHFFSVFSMKLLTTSIESKALIYHNTHCSSFSDFEGENKVVVLYLKVQRINIL